MQQVRMQGESGLCGPLSLLRMLPSQDETAIYGFVNPWHQPSPSANTCSASSSIVTGCPAERFSTPATSPRMQPVNCPFCGQSKSQDHLLLLLSIVHTRPTSGFLPGLWSVQTINSSKKREHNMHRSIHHESLFTIDLDEVRTDAYHS